MFKPYKNGASIPLPKDGSVPCHLAVSLFRDGTSSAQLVTMPDNFAVPMHHCEKCFDLELERKSPTGETEDPPSDSDED